MSKKVIMIPYDCRGNMLESSYQNYPDVCVRPLGNTPYTPYTPYTHYTYGTAFWKPNDPFTTKLTYMKWARGKSAVTIYMSDDSGHEFPMIGRYFFDIVHLMDKGSITGTWKPIKRGATYGLDLIS